MSSDLTLKTIIILTLYNLINTVISRDQFGMFILGYSRFHVVLKKKKKKKSNKIKTSVLYFNISNIIVLNVHKVLSMII